MGNFEDVKNRFLTSYSLVVRMGVSSFQIGKGILIKAKLVESGWNLNVGILGVPRAILFCQMMREFEPGQAWCYLFLI